MKHKQNLHIHTTYADGRDTPEAMVLQAIDRGFDSIGFSEHSFLRQSPAPKQMTVPEMEPYKEEIRGLKAKYQGTIDIFCGMELDFYSQVPSDGFDYLIGSVHYLDCGDTLLGFDRDLPRTLDYINTNFGGNALAFAEAYFDTVARLPQKAKIDILGHFDLLTKNNEAGQFIDPAAPEYLSCGYRAIHALKGKIPLFEVNTGAISRGYRTSPYPQMEFLKEFHRCGFGAVITSDCHDKHFIDCFYPQAEQLLAQAGFTSKWILTDKGFTEVAL